MSRESGLDNSTARDSDPLFASEHGDDRFRHCLQNREKRVEDPGLSRKRSLEKISANVKRTDLALAA